MTLEGLVILVSILAAFALDAGWERLQSASALSQDLDGVRAEMGRNLDRVRTEVDALQRILAGSEALLSIMEAESDHETIVVPDTLAFLVSNWAPTLDLSFGALDALIQSGRLGDIGDAELKTGLSGLKERTVDAVEDELVARDVMNDRLFPLLSRGVELGEIARIDLEFFSVEDRVGQEIPSYTTVTYPNDLEVRNVVRYRAAWLGSALSEMGRLRAHIEDLNDRLPTLD
jgi:hypothetical protein